MEKNTNNENNEPLYYCTSRAANWEKPGGVITAIEARRRHDTRGVYVAFHRQKDGRSYFIEVGGDVLTIVILDEKLRQIGDASFVEGSEGHMHLSSLYEWQYPDDVSKTPSQTTYWHIRKNGTGMVSRSTNVQELRGLGNRVFGPVKEFIVKRPAFGEYGEFLHLYFEAREIFHLNDSTIVC